MNRPLRMVVTTILVGAVVSAGACGGDEQAASPPPSTAPPSTAAPAAPSPTQPPPVEPGPAAAPADAGFPPEQLDAMVAPIALYPDALLMQVLMASTYPTEIVMADRWRQGHLDLEGAALDEALAQQEWDPSVSSLAFFPDVLHRMSENLEWTTDLGDAFLAQQDDVMDACQRMRMKASEAGTLQTTKEQTVIVEKEVVRIEPADPEVVYVPQYNTTTAYGSAYQPPPQYYPAVQTGYSETALLTTGLLSFGAGMLTSYALWGDCDWDDHDVYYGGYGGGGGPKYTNKVNIGGKGDDTINIDVGGDRRRWDHDPQHRRGVAYPDHHSRERYARNDPRRTRFDEDRARGYDREASPGDRGRPEPRPGGPGGAGQARPPKMPDRPATKPAQRPAQKKPAQAARPAPKKQPTPAARQQASRQPAAGNSAFGGSRNANVQRQASQRGAMSRGRSAQPGMGARGGGYGGGHGGGGGKSRGGGGGRRR